MSECQDPALVATYAFSVRSRRCPCGSLPVGFFRCRHTSTGKVVEMYSCQGCLNLETKWTATRIPDPKAKPADGQLDLLL